MTVSVWVPSTLQTSMKAFLTVLEMDCVTGDMKPGSWDVLARAVCSCGVLVRSFAGDCGLNVARRRSYAQRWVACALSRASSREGTVWADVGARQGRPWGCGVRLSCEPDTGSARGSPCCVLGGRSAVVGGLGSDLCIEGLRCVGCSLWWLVGGDGGRARMWLDVSVAASSGEM